MSMNARGILRKTSPTKKRNLTTHLGNVKQSQRNTHLIDHNHDIDSENANKDFDDKYKYSKSAINSTKRVVQKLEHLKKLTIKPSTSTAELSPRTKVIVTEKALKKLNVVSDAKVYKNLPPVNVNDSILGVNRQIRKDKKPIASSTVDPNPTLDMFLKPSVDLEYRLELSDSNSDDELMTPQSICKDNFQRLYDTYRQYFDPMKYRKSKSL